MIVISRTANYIKNGGAITMHYLSLCSGIEAAIAAQDKAA